MDINNTQALTANFLSVNSNCSNENQLAKKNYLLDAALQLLTFITQVRHTIEHNNVAKLKAQVIEEIKRFESRLAKISYPIRSIIAARYCLCTAIDEAVLNCSWGTQSIWIQQSLLSLFHKETWGGERFYIILEEMAKEPRQNIDFLEFAYVLLSLGFEGKFYGKSLAIREEIRNRIFYRIRYSKEKPDKTLSKPRKEHRLIDERRIENIRLKLMCVIAISIFIAAAIFYNVRLHEAARPFIHSVNQIANVSPVTTFSQVIERPIIERDLN